MLVSLNRLSDDGLLFFTRSQHHHRFLPSNLVLQNLLISSQQESQVEFLLKRTGSW